MLYHIPCDGGNTRSLLNCSKSARQFLMSRTRATLSRKYSPKTARATSAIIVHLKVRVIQKSNVSHKSKFESRWPQKVLHQDPMISAIGAKQGKPIQSHHYQPKYSILDIWPMIYKRLCSTLVVAKLRWNTSFPPESSRVAYISAPITKLKMVPTL